MRDGDDELERPVGVARVHGQFEELTPAGGSDPGSPEFTEYGYDDESRLVGVRYPDDTAALYQLDAGGNRVGERKAASSMVPALTVAAFLALSPSALTNDVVAVFSRANWLESVTDARAPAKDATFEWDAAGNLTRQQTAGRDRRFTWDVKQTLTKVEDDGIEAGRYDYGADGLRSKRVTALESVEYVLDGMQVLVETDGATSGHPAKRRYTYAANALAVTDISGATRTTKALHLDALGSPVGETTQTGQVSVVRQYDAWGQYRNGTAPGSTEAKLGYTGHQFDPETKLVYARARYYDPEYGRFLSRDSYEGALNSAPSLHRFSYARTNPLRYTDPDGHDVFDLPNPLSQFEAIWHQAGEAIAESPPVQIATGAADVIGEGIEAQKVQTLGEFGFGTPEEVAVARKVQSKRVKEDQIWGPPGSPGATVKDIIGAFMHTGANLGTGIAACDAGSYYECGRTLPFGIAGAVMLVEGGVSLGRPGVSSTSAKISREVAESGGAEALTMAPKNPLVGPSRFDAKLASNAAEITPKKGRTDVVVHADEKNFFVKSGPTEADWAKLPADRLATIIRERGYESGPIRLISCEAGKCANGPAQQLANELRAPILAPTEKAHVWPDGRITLGPKPTSNTGDWKWFKPEAKKPE